MGKTTLAVMAAGIGSRFGKGIKQLEPVGPSGQIIIDYSIRDAVEAGFDRVVFIIRKDLDKDFREIIGDRIAKKVEVAYAYQEGDDLPAGFTKPAARTKPWGTGQAILATRGIIREPFAVINADDYYGKEPYRLLYQYLNEPHTSKDGVEQICMAGFRLGNTLSENGGVTRGICDMDAEGRLIGIRETSNIIKTPEGAAIVTDEGQIPVDPASHVSMNMWGLQASFIDLLEDGFIEFLRSVPEGDIKKEFLLPVFIDQLMKSGKATVDVLDTKETWFGVTYQEDKDAVKAAIRALTDQGLYPESF